MKFPGRSIDEAHKIPWTIRVRENFVYIPHFFWRLLGLRVESKRTASYSLLYWLCDHVWYSGASHFHAFLLADYFHIFWQWLPHRNQSIFEPFFRSFPSLETHNENLLFYWKSIRLWNLSALYSNLNGFWPKTQANWSWLLTTVSV